MAVKLETIPKPSFTRRSAREKLLLSLLLPVFLSIYFPYSQWGVLDVDVITTHEDRVWLDPEQAAFSVVARIPEHPNPVAAKTVESGITGDSQVDTSKGPLSSCSVTSQVRVLRNEKTHEWILQSVDAHGNDKTTGGDEYYVTYTLGNPPHGGRKPTAVARVEDLGNGKYGLDFVTTPFPSARDAQILTNSTSAEASSGTLTVHFQYSCGIGSLPQPVKANWRNGGSTGISHTVNALARPKWRVFQSPNEDKTIDLSRFDLVISFGDSLMRHFIGAKKGVGCGREERRWCRDKTYFHRVIHLHLAPDTVDRFLHMLEQWHGKELRDTSQSNALVLGSAMWDLLEPRNIQGSAFDGHLRACVSLVTKVRSAYPSATIFWKLPLAVHSHTVVCRNDPRCRQRTKYLSSSRMEYLYKQQQMIMKGLGVVALDMYEASYLSSSELEPGDGRHYNREFDLAMLDWFYADHK